jgi:hypothetical protein
LKKNITFLQAAAVLLTISISSIANASPGYTAKSIIAGMGVGGNGIDMYLPQANNPMGCSATGLFRLKINTPNYDAIASFLITQYASQKGILVWAYACDTDGASLLGAANAEL